MRPVDAAAFFGDELPALIADRADLAVARRPRARPAAVRHRGRRRHAGRCASTTTDFTVTPGHDDAAAVVRARRRRPARPRQRPAHADGLLHRRRPRHAVGPARGLPRLVGRAAVADRRPPVHTRRRRRLPRPRRRAARPQPRASRLDDDPSEISPLPRPRPASCTSPACSPTTRWQRSSADMDARRAALRRTATAARGGRRPKDGERPAASACSTSSEHSPTTAATCSPTTASSGSPAHRRRPPLGKPHVGRNLIEALVKPIGVVEGISDVPWHKDCSLGSHSYRCCSLTVGISVTGADADVGPAPRGRRLAPRPRPAGVRPPRPRPAAGRPADRDRRRHRAPAAARCT